MAPLRALVFNAAMTNLFSPLRLGDLDLPNRIFMAPLTRSRAGENRIPNELMAEYYSQRASATWISPTASSWHR